MTPTKALQRLLMAVLLSSCCSLTADAIQLSPELYRRDVVEQRLRRLGPRPVEGLWLLTGPGSAKAIVAVERADTDHFDSGSYIIVVVEAEDRAVVPGTVIGSATASADPDIFDVSIASDISSGIPSRHKQYTLTLFNSGDRFRLTPRSGKFRINLYAAMPFMFIRPSITSRTGTQSKSPDQGAIRIFPRPSRPTVPVYL